MSTIAIDRVSKRFGRGLAFADVGLDVASGELLAPLRSPGFSQTPPPRGRLGPDVPRSGRIRLCNPDTGDRPVRDAPLFPVRPGLP